MYVGYDLSSAIHLLTERESSLTSLASSNTESLIAKGLLQKLTFLNSHQN